MRCDQFPGLPKHALEFLEEWRKRCGCCGQFLPSPLTVGHYVGMFEDEYSLTQYCLRDGRTADEFLQAEPWSSGPMFFLGLKVSDGQEFLWTQEDINNGTW